MEPFEDHCANHCDYSHKDLNNSDVCMALHTVLGSFPKHEHNDAVLQLILMCVPCDNAPWKFRKGGKLSMLKNLNTIMTGSAVFKLAT